MLSGGSESAMRTKKREAQWWPRINFLTQLKQRPRSRWLAISVGVRCFRGIGGGLGGGGNRGRVGGGGEDRGMVGGLGGK